MSNDLLSRQSKVLAQGETSPNSKRQSAFIQGVYPSHLVKGDGCYVWDQNGKRYIDFISGLGTNLLGYAHPKVTEAVRYAAGIGPTLSLPHPIEIEVAELIREMIPCAEKVRFLKSGNESTLAAVRIARAYQLKDRNADWFFKEENRERAEVEKKEQHMLGIVESSGYHGHGDLWTSYTAPRIGIIGDFAIQGGVTLDRGGCIAIVEPARLDVTADQIENMQLLRSNKTVVIFDEVVTGFRFPKLTVSNTWNIKPDIICLGKGLANGYPLSVVAGKKEVMDCGEYFISSTFSGEIVSLYAAKATLEFLRANDPKVFWDFGDNLRTKINAVLKPIDVQIEGYATRGMFDVSKLNTVLLMQEACKAGILLGKAWFPCWAHMEAGIEETVLTLLSDIVRRMEQGKVKLEGNRPVETFKR